MTCGLSHTERRARLIEQHGQPEPFSRAEALRLAGITEPGLGEVVAYLYRDRAAADAYHRSNREHDGPPVLAVVDTDEGPVGILDLRITEQPPQAATGDPCGSGPIGGTGKRKSHESRTPPVPDPEEDPDAAS